MIDQKDVIQYRDYRCRIKIRPSFDGREVKPGMWEHDGKEFVLQVMWIQDENDKYPGEYAWADSYRSKVKMNDVMNIGWISGGDIEVLEPVT